MWTQTRIAALASVIAAVLIGACGGGGSGASSESAASPTAAPPLRVVALGDSETTGAGDPTGAGWVGRYAKLLERKRGLETQVMNLSVEGKTSAELLSEVRGDPRTRRALQDAQVILLGIGGADLNAGDDAFAAGECRGTACYRPVMKAFARNFEATVGAIRDLRGRDDAVLRSITQFNALVGAEDVIPPFLRDVASEVGRYQARTANRAICAAMARFDGRCVDLLRAFNGAGGTGDGYRRGVLNHTDCCYANAKGQQLMAELLFRTGLAPVH